jgi:hypothetical protein
VVCASLVDHGESAGYNSGRDPEVKRSADAAACLVKTFQTADFNA